MNMNTKSIVDKINENDQDGDGLIDYDEFLTLLGCLKEAQKIVQANCIGEIERLVFQEKDEIKVSEINQLFRKTA